MDIEATEFFKLDPIDRKTLFWMMDHAPDAIRSWLEYVAEEYRDKKQIVIDHTRLRMEVEIELEKKT
ncbi:MAG TPA: hypothetical protein VG737_16680 [Cyclobacteriaceae bacterium]|nr:hypothetical protein [Cyclobacteriaceae bacterium]